MGRAVCAGQWNASRHFGGRSLEGFAQRGLASVFLPLATEEDAQQGPFLERGTRGTDPAQTPQSTDADRPVSKQ